MLAEQVLTSQSGYISICKHCQPSMLKSHRIAINHQYIIGINAKQKKNYIDKLEKKIQQTTQFTRFPKWDLQAFFNFKLISVFNLILRYLKSPILMIVTIRI